MVLCCVMCIMVLCLVLVFLCSLQGLGNKKFIVVFSNLKNAKKYSKGFSFKKHFAGLNFLCLQFMVRLLKLDFGILVFHFAL
jgi:hypothetical protein